MMLIAGVPHFCRDLRLIIVMLKYIKLEQMIAFWHDMRTYSARKLK